MFVKNEKGFTLLEVLIAVAIMAVAFSAILMVQSASINATLKARDMTVVAMLAKNAMVQTEMEIQGLPFNELKEEETFDFEKPFQDYQWRREVTEIELPSLAGAFTSAGGENSNTSEAETFAKLFSEYMSKAIREIKITVSWQKGKGRQEYSVSTYWVDLNSDFKLSL